jgi:blue copper oxidase
LPERRRRLISRVGKTWLVEDRAELLVAFNRPAWRDHPFMYHCHILEHEEAGLMGQYVCA